MLVTENESESCVEVSARVGRLSLYHHLAAAAAAAIMSVQIAGASRRCRRRLEVVKLGVCLTTIMQPGIIISGVRGKSVNMCVFFPPVRVNNI